MKVTLSNGEPFFYQWDKNQKISISIDAETVHFMMSEQNAKEVLVKNGWAAVPNELLKKAEGITLYACDSTHTKEYAFIRVKPRPKPDGYISTPEEAAAWEDMVAEKARESLPSIGENGNWFIGGVDSGLPARGPKGEAQGTMDHTDLRNRDAEGQHPISAITGLTGRLAETPRIYIGADEPEEGPVLWFDTGATPGTGLNLSEDSSNAIVVAEVDGKTYGVGNAGVNEDPTEGKYSFDII